MVTIHLLTAMNVALLLFVFILFYQFVMCIPTLKMMMMIDDEEDFFGFVVV